jgi:uncharacterized membrane protein YfcA
MQGLDAGPLALAAALLLLAGVLKGATGAGAPILAVPAVALLFDVRTAVAVMATPNLVTNLWQAWDYRAVRPPRAFTWRFTIAAMAGAALGTWALASMPKQGPALMVAAGVFAYLGFRLARPHWSLGPVAARRLAAPVGLVSGLMQGASGLSAPVSLTFLNAVKMDRPAFIAVASAVFAGMSVTQIPALALFGALTPPVLLASLGAVAPILLGMPLGRWLAGRVPPRLFDGAIQILLAAIAAKLVYETLD